MRDHLLKVTPLEDGVIPVGGAGTLELGGCLHPVLWQEESYSHLWYKEKVGDGVLMDSAVILLPFPKNRPLLDVGDLGPHEPSNHALGWLQDLNKIFDLV